MRKAITAALEGDLIRGSRRRPVGVACQFIWVADWLTCMSAASHAHLLRPNAGELWNLLGTY